MSEIFTRIVYFLAGEKYAPPSHPGLLDPPSSDTPSSAHEA